VPVPQVPSVMGFALALLLKNLLQSKALVVMEASNIMFAKV
jgi:hypothetical protein